MPILLAVLCRRPHALFFVRLPIAALTLDRAIADAAAAVTALESVGNLRLRFGAEMARIGARARYRCTVVDIITLGCIRRKSRIFRALCGLVGALLRRRRTGRFNAAAVACRLVERPAGPLTLLRAIARIFAEAALENFEGRFEAVVARLSLRKCLQREQRDASRHVA